MVTFTLGFTARAGARTNVRAASSISSSRNCVQLFEPLARMQLSHLQLVKKKSSKRISSKLRAVNSTTSFSFCLCAGVV